MGLKCTSRENLLNAFSLFAIRVERGGRGIRGTIEQSCSSVDTGVPCLLKCKPSYYTDASGGQFSRRRPKKKLFAMELEELWTAVSEANILIVLFGGSHAPGTYSVRGRLGRVLGYQSG